MTDKPKFAPKLQEAEESIDEAIAHIKEVTDPDSGLSDDQRRASIVLAIQGIVHAHTLIGFVREYFVEPAETTGFLEPVIMPVGD